MTLDFSVLIWFVLSLFATSAIVQVIYGWGILGKLAFYKPSTEINTDEEPVSIIIASRNELQNLELNLRAILEQDYPKFEVVVVNDCSWDESQKFLETLQEEYKHLKVSQLVEQEKYPTGKKFALTIGIKAASYNKMLFTDADCAPASNQWLRLMQQQYTIGKEIILGFSPYRKVSGLLNAFVRFESLLAAANYFGFALMKNAFMGVGRNLSYTKDVFFRHKGFASHNHLPSGDDDLFVNEAARPNNVAIQIHPDSFVYTEAKKSYSAYSRQKVRHLHVGKYYKKKHKRILAIYYISIFLFYATLVSTLVLNLQTWPIVSAVYGIRLISMTTILYLCAKKLQSVSVVWLLPLFDIIYLWYLMTIGLQAYFTKKIDRW
jgi:glycosyltransferase involved in cell wall biosynthesis